MTILIHARALKRVSREPAHSAEVAYFRNKVCFYIQVDSPRNPATHNRVLCFHAVTNDIAQEEGEEALEGIYEV